MVFDGTPYVCFVINSWMQGTTKINQFVFKFLSPDIRKWKSHFVKKYKKNINDRIHHNNNNESNKNNIFSIYNEVEQSKISTRHFSKSGKKKPQKIMKLVNLPRQNGAERTLHLIL